MRIVALIDHAEGPTTEIDTSPRSAKRLVDRLGPRSVRALTIIGFSLPVLAYLWLIEHYGVNVIEGDQWDDVTVIRASHVHLFSWGVMWAQHNENRIFFPNLLVVAMSRTTHFNILDEEYLSALMLIGAAMLILSAHKRRAPGIPWLYYVPAVFVIFSFAQFGNTLWGFQMAWFLVLLAFAGTLFLLDRLELNWISYSGAIACAVVGSFSSLQGLLIWPVGIFLLYHRRRSWPWAAGWIASGVASTILYFYNFNQSTLGNGAVKYPFASLKFFLFALGDVLGFQIQYKKPPAGGIVIFGAVVFGLALIAIIRFGIRRDQHGAGPIGVALILMGLLFAATVTEGRLIFGYWAAGASRYTTFDLLVPLGIYLTAISSPKREVAMATATGSAEESGTPLPFSPVPGRRDWLYRIGRPAFAVAVIAVIVVQIAFSVPNSIKGARDNFVYQAKGAQLLRDINHSSDGEIVYYLSVFDTAAFIRSQTLTLEKYHLNVFAGRSDGP
jgi:hypothetical protein